MSLPVAQKAPKATAEKTATNMHAVVDVINRTCDVSFRSEPGSANRKRIGFNYRIDVVLLKRVIAVKAHDAERGPLQQKAE